MTANTDPQRRPVLFDLKNQRLLADPVVGNRYYVIPSAGMQGADATIDLINTATSSVISAARVVAATTSSAGVVQLTDSVGSTSSSTAATANAVRSAYELADAALPKSGGVMSGTITFAAGQTLAGYAALGSLQVFSAAQRGQVVTLTPGATVTPDFAAANYFDLSLDQNTVLANPLNLAAGQSGAITLRQDGTGRSLSYGSYWKFEGGAPSLNATPGSVSVLAYYVDTATRITAQLISNTLS